MQRMLDYSSGSPGIVCYHCYQKDNHEEHQKVIGISQWVKVIVMINLLRKMFPIASTIVLKNVVLRIHIVFIKSKALKYGVKKLQSLTCQWMVMRQKIYL